MVPNNRSIFPRAAGHPGCAVDQLDLQVGADLGHVVAGEIGAVVAVQGGRQPADRPRRVRLYARSPAATPTPSATRSGRRGTRCTRRPPGTGRPGSRSTTAGPAGPDSSSTITSSSVWSACHRSFGLRRLPAQHQFEIVAVGRVALVRQRHQTPVQAGDDPVAPPGTTAPASPARRRSAPPPGAPRRPSAAAAATPCPRSG